VALGEAPARGGRSLVLRQAQEVLAWVKARLAVAVEALVLNPVVLEAASWSSPQGLGEAGRKRRKAKGWTVVALREEDLSSVEGRAVAERLVGVLWW